MAKTTAATTTVGYQDLIDWGAQLLVRFGAQPDDARYMAETAVTTEAAGVPTHGVVIFGYFASQLGKGLDPAARPEVVAERPGCATIDGRRCFSPLAMRMAVQLGRDKAKANGVAMVGVRNTCWIGGLGSYLLPLAADGLFAQLWAQSSQCKDSAPVGGVDPRFSTNPVAMVFPTPGDPVVADFSTSVYSMGKVNTMIRQGRKAPEPVFFGPDGQLTDDPGVMQSGGAMIMAGGAINEHKGYSLALWSEALTAMIGGSCNNPALEQRQCVNLTVIDPAAFATDADYYNREISRFIDHVRGSRRRDGVEQIRLPGERMLAKLRDSQARGVELSDVMLAKLNELAAAHKIERLKPLQ